MSVRVAKGVTLRSSATRGHADKAITRVAAGELVITNRRIIFAGDAKSCAIDLNDLLNATHYVDGFAFHDSHATHVLAMNDRKSAAVFGIVLDKVLKANGSMR